MLFSLPKFDMLFVAFGGGELVVLMDMNIHILSDVTFPPQIRHALRRIWGRRIGCADGHGYSHPD
jgi:hypothetical protein